ncbi:MAG: V-type ATPase 116kDa subunit family protein [Pseudomonadota bacterium]
MGIFRSEQAKWFETYVPREETVIALEALAGSGLVVLESDQTLAKSLTLGGIRTAVDEYRRLMQRHGDLLQQSLLSKNTVIRAPEKMAEEALECLNDWSKLTDGLQKEQLDLTSSRQNLMLLLEYLVAQQGSSSDIVRLSHRSDFLYKGLFACPKEHPLEAGICAALDEYVPGERYNFFIVADLPDNQSIIEKTCHEETCVHIEVPDWLPSEPDKQLSQVKTRLAELDGRLEVLAQKLDAGRHDPEVVAASETMSLLSWFVDNAETLSEDRKLCHVTGWTTAEQADKLQQALNRTGIHAVIRFAEAPEYIKPPVSLLLPVWARPFLPFVEMLGTPGRGEVNPTLLLPVVVSLLFGYMFPDVGHGLLLVLLSLLLFRRWPKGRFLIPCGLSAILFGFVFGEFFGLEGILEPLWLSPLEHPLQILIPPVFFGIGLMLLGLVFNGIEAYWRGELLIWLLRDAAVLTLYTALLAGIFEIQMLWLAGMAIVWFILGQVYQTLHSRLNKLLSNLALLLQSLFELVLNTVSFLRVGAFALAHAALSTAVIQIANGIDNPVLHVILLVVGHLMIVALEGLVVFVQTTRLVLFEFFTRFLRAEGRIFRPMSSVKLENEE